MNDPNRKIDVNISSLLSLKAELLRKKTEVNQAKSRQAAQPFVPKSFERVNNDKDKPNVDTKPGPRANRVELEDNEQLQRSRMILESKAKFYDRMAESGGGCILNSDDNCLVMFNAKKQATRVESSSSEEESDTENDRGATELAEEDWVEYTDSLGRTRKCLRTDLKFFKKRDESLAKEFGDQVKEKPATPDANPVDKFDNSTESESEDELLKTGRQIQQMRDHWDRQEEDNKDKEFVHYQDVLFDEARTHGVGYFQFSTDAEERIKQQKELDVRRQATLSAQKERDVQRAARERILAERVLAAKNRQRARVGLPPLEKMEECQSVESTGPVSTTTPLMGSEKTEEEEIREMDRKTHLRPWDVGKEGTSNLIPAEEKEWTYKNHREPMSQEEWNEKKRGERNSEFAPTGSLDKSNVKLKETQMWKVDVMPRNPAKPDVDIDAHQDFNFEEEEEEEEEKPGLYFTTKKKKLKRKNYQPAAEEEFESHVQKRAEIPPPPTFDYYGPSILGLTKKPKPSPSPTPNLQSSIEAGLKFLRNQTDKSQSTSKSMWGANANYGKDM